MGLRVARRAPVDFQMVDLILGRQLVFESPLSVQEMTARLRREIAEPTYYPFERRTNLFEGTLVDGRFRMVRLARGRNSLRPVISGRVSPGARGTQIDLRLRLHPGVLALLAIVLTAGVGAASIALPEYLRSRQLSVPLAIAALMAWMLMGLIVSAAVEGRRAARTLAAFFETTARRAGTPG